MAKGHVLIPGSTAETRQQAHLLTSNVIYRDRANHQRTKAEAELELRRRKRASSLAEASWGVWLHELFPDYVSADFAPHQAEFWDWGWEIQPKVRPRPFIAVWARGGAKSTSAELLTVAIGAKQKRRYAWYVSETQDQADNHVDTIATMLESSKIGSYYSDLATRLVGKYGNSRGWRRNRLRTAGDFTIDAMGLDTASRGSKIGDARPDLIILDDLDGKLDTPEETDRKIEILTTSLLPAGSNDLAILGVQNLIIPHGIFARLVDGTAGFLMDAIISGPHPAVRNLAYEQTPSGFMITAGEATWKGQPLAVCEYQLRDWGPTAFLKEAQHEVETPPGGMFNNITYQHCDWIDVPWGQIVRTSIWVDPAVTSTDQSDSMGIQADALSEDGKIYRLWSWEQRASPAEALRRAILKAIEFKCDFVGVETDQGGDTWESVYHLAIALLEEEEILEPNTFRPAFTWAKAGAGHGSKVHRASQMLTDYERNVFIHVRGTHQILERALNRFPKTKPLDLVDAAYWCWYDLAESTADLLLW